MDKFHSLLVAIFLLRALEETYSTYHGNIYGIQKLKGNKTGKSVYQHFWFKRHHVHLRQRYPKTLMFARMSMSQCSKKKNIKIIQVKRIGGDYPYGPKLSSISENQICRPTTSRSSSPHFSSIAFSTSRQLNFPKKSSKSLNQVHINLAKRKQWKRNKAWCTHCESYWKMKINSKQLKSRYPCC
ncbi:uncharacterized protein CELE_C05D9.4 [Caenorhabditis elegans]|uniref:Uncharacterized protein n=1 Tax=Caenorhabditis elegans TaxID=6239 RepID=Q9GYK3_CAEEL|nr:Uncharacterized protein CELE_C05D9.4 [Caenorhabditis elegans]CCD63149.2 Uncharacterized protein CELE_C05D9.4 [Caenorhabditis elegans]